MSAPLVLAVGLLLGVPRPALAQRDGDRHLWMQGVATVALDGPWRVQLEGQPRWFENVTAPFQVLVRAGVGQKVAPRVTAWAGYGWIAKPPGEGFTAEHRAWQQMSVAGPAAGRWATSFRWRQEQRFQENWAAASHRTRVLVRAQRPVAPGWTAIAWSESMVTWNGAAGGPVRGFDQNRLFGGMGRRLAPGTVVEAGYVWLAQRQPSGRRVDAHVGLVSANFAW